MKIRKILSLILLPISLISISCSHKSGKVVILYTSNVLGNFLGSLSYSSLKRIKTSYEKQNNDVLLFDLGDHLSGGPTTTLNNGKEIINLMNAVGYDAACFGEYEFEWGVETLDKLTKSASFPYISTNFYHYDPDNKKLLDPVVRLSKIFQTQNKKIGVFALTNPYVTTFANPKHFRNDKGQCVYSFLYDNNELYSKAQYEIDYLKSNGADYVICLSHLGTNEAKKYNTINLIKNTSGLDCVLDGHSYDINPSGVVKDKNNKPVLFTELGKDFSNVGVLTISNNGTISSNFIDSYEDLDKDVTAIQEDIYEDLSAKYGTPVIKAKNKFYRSLKTTTNLGDLCSDALYYFANYVLSTPEFGSIDSKCDFALVSSGAIKEEIDYETWTVLDCRSTLLRNDCFSVKQIKGKLLRDYFEFATRDYNFKELEGLPQISATIRMNIDSKKESKVVVDEAGNFISGPKEDKDYRIVSFEIYNTSLGEWQNLDDNKYYRVASSDLILSGGFGATMFAQENEDCKTIFSVEMQKDKEFKEYQILGYYLSLFTPSLTSDVPILTSANCPFSSDIKSSSNLNYESPVGSTRISIIDKNYN